MAGQDVKGIASRTGEEEYQRNDIIINEGDIDTCFYMIVEGRVDVYKSFGKKSEQWVRSMGPCTYFGEMALLDDMVRSASVVAIEITRTLVLDRWNLQEEIKRYPTIAMELLRMLSRRIRANEKYLLKSLGAFVPICVKCNRICEDKTHWMPIETYIEDHLEAELSNTICPECSQVCYPQFYDQS